jgi:acyl carrier protein
MTTQSEDHTASIREELIAILSRAAGVPASAVEEAPDAPLPDLGLDSLASLQFQAAVQDRFRVLIPEDALEMSFPEITRFVAERFDGVA